MFLVTVSVSSSWTMELVKGHRTRNVWNGLARLPRRGALAGAGAVAGRTGFLKRHAHGAPRPTTLHTFIYLIPVYDHAPLTRTLRPRNHHFFNSFGLQ